MKTSRPDIDLILMQCGKETFLAKGFEGATLRSICEKAGVTTGAFYAHFPSKEALFRALVQPVLRDFHKVYAKAVEQQLQDFTVGEESEAETLHFVAEHRDEFRLLLDCAKGTTYEGYRDWLFESFFYPSCQKLFDHHAGKAVDPVLVRIILRMKFSEYLEIIYGCFTVEREQELAALLSSYSRAGFQALLRQLRAPSDDLAPEGFLHGEKG